MKFIKSTLKTILIIAGVIVGIMLLIAFLAVVLTYVCIAALVGKLLNRYGNVTRREGNTVYMPIVEFKNPRDGKRVSYLGCMHIGNHSYYQTLEHYIQLHKNALVLCEGVKESTNQSAEEIAKKDYALIASLVGAVSQYTMHYQPEWVFNDLPLEKMQQLSRLLMNMGKKKDGKTLRETIQELDDEKRKTWGKAFSFAFLHMNFIKCLMIIRRKKWRERVIMHHVTHVRNNVAVRELDKYLPDNNHLILLWGAAHLPGIKKLLRKRGFEQVEKQWIPAFTKTV